MKLSKLLFGLSGFLASKNLYKLGHFHHSLFQFVLTHVFKKLFINGLIFSYVEWHGRELNEFLIFTL